MIFNAVLIVICVAILFFSISRYLRYPVSKAMKTVFIVIKVFIVGLLAIAFLEPRFTLERLASSEASIPVLIDASMSMRLFKPDSTVKPLINKLIELGKKGGPKFSFFLFGDTLREMKPGEIQFGDHRSFFPVNLSAPVFRGSSDLLIVTDGNWSNATMPSGALLDKNVRFLELPPSTPVPYLQVNASAPLQSPADTPAILSINLSGRLEKADSVKIEVFESTSRLRTIGEEIGSGSFSKAISIQLPEQKPGTYIYKVKVRAGDSLYAESFTAHQIIPDNFTYFLYSAKPSLDRRFLPLALAKTRSFTRITDESTMVDCLILFDWDKKAAQYVKNLKKSGIVVFAGCVPCSTISHYKTDNLHYVVPPEVYGELFRGINLSEIPPPAEIIDCRQNNANVTPLIRMTGSGEGGDTLNVVYYGKFGRFSSLTIAAREFWRWDFWPLSVGEGEEEAFSFSQILLSSLKNALSSQLGNGYYAYPSEMPAASIPTTFALLFPPAIAAQSNPTISFLFRKEGKKIGDTTLHYYYSGTSRPTTVFPPLDRGFYQYETVLKSAGYSAVYRDSLYVGKESAEFMSGDQNTSLLKELGRGLNLSEIDGNTFSTDNEGGRMLRETVQISRTWPLLIIILILFAAEWTLRKIKELD